MADGRPTSMPDKDASKAEEPRVPKLQVRHELILKRGRSLAAAKKFEEASGVLGRLLEMCTKASDDALSIDMAPIYFEYGNTLLEQVLEATTGAEAAEAHQDIEPSSSSSAAATGVDIEQTDIEELLEISWECLEPARLSYEKHSNGESAAAVANRERLAATLCRLGQVQELSGRAEDGARDMMESLKLYESLPSPSQRDLADVNLLISNVWLALANSSDDDTSSPKLAVAIKHHIAAFQALHRRCVNSIRGMGAGAAPLVDAVEAWWASLPASKGDAVDVAAEGAAAVASADAAAAAAASASDVSASVALADTTAPLLSPEALGGEANAGEAKRLLLTMRQLQERLEEIVEGNEAVAAQLSKTRASEAGGTAAPKRSREGEDSESGTKRTKGDE